MNQTAITVANERTASAMERAYRDARLADERAAAEAGTAARHVLERLLRRRFPKLVLDIVEGYDGWTLIVDSTRRLSSVPLRDRTLAEACAIVMREAYRQ